MSRCSGLENSTLILLFDKGFTFSGAKFVSVNEMPFCQAERVSEVLVEFLAVTIMAGLYGGGRSLRGGNCSGDMDATLAKDGETFVGGGCADVRAVGGVGALRTLSSSLIHSRIVSLRSSFEGAVDVDVVPNLILVMAFSIRSAAKIMSVLILRLRLPERSTAAWMHSIISAISSNGSRGSMLPPEDEMM